MMSGCVWTGYDDKRHDRMTWKGLDGHVDKCQEEKNGVWMCWTGLYSKEWEGMTWDRKEQLCRIGSRSV